MTTAETATDTATDTAGTTRLTDVAESAGPAAPIGPESPLSDIFELAQQLRVDSIRSSTAAGSGHPTSGMSAADLMAVLMARHLRYDWLDPGNPANDYLIFSKGHASPLLYSMFKAAGVVSDQELVETYRRAGSRLQGHPTPVLPWVPAATGSLGQGIGIGVGIAQACRTVTPSPSRIWVLCGDSEMTEGSVWEALDRAGNDGLANFTVVVDVNRLGQRGPTELGWDLRSYARRVEGFGCVPLLVEGHDLGQIDDAFREAADSGRPTVILARTRKGRGFSEVENKPGWHGKALPPDMAERAVAELGGERSLTVRGREPAAVAGTPTGPWPGAPHVDLPEYRLGVPVAPRAAVGEALAALGVRPEVVVLDAEVGNSTHTEDFGKAYPDRYFECYIAEQQMTASAVGMSVRRLKPFAATFAAFWTRAHDFVRMAAISQAKLGLIGTHCGVEIGEDGPSQMGLEDLAMMRCVQGSTVLYPSDATSAAALTVTMADLPGVSYLRATRGAYPVLYGPGESFPIGGSKTLVSSAADAVTLIGAGVTVHECLAASAELADSGIAARVVDMYSVKPVDSAGLLRAVAETRALVLVEDHHPQGGLGEAVLSELARRGVEVTFVHKAVESLPASGTPAECLDAAGISAGHIVRTVEHLLKS